MFAYIMGRWPNDGFYKFYAIIVPLLILIRFINYKSKNWHYFLVDFCYFAGAIVILSVFFYPKNEILYRLAFLYSNGMLAVSTAAFNNALIFHQLDHLISLCTHPVPLICMWNVKHVTMEYEATLPEDKRVFLQHDTSEPFFSSKQLYLNFVLPYIFYFIWAILYYIFNFIVKEKRIREREYFTLYTYYQTVQWTKTFITKNGLEKIPSPLMFMIFHFIYFSISHIFALLAYYFSLIHTILTFTWLLISIWNGSCYYVKFFEYTKKLSLQ